MKVYNECFVFRGVFCEIPAKYEIRIWSQLNVLKLDNVSSVFSMDLFLVISHAYKCARNNICGIPNRKIPLGRY